MKEIILNDSNDQSNSNSAAENENINITQVLKTTSAIKVILKF